MRAVPARRASSQGAPGRTRGARPDDADDGAARGTRGGGARRFGPPARIALGSLVLIAALFLFVFPTRAYLAQRHHIDQVRGDLTTLQEQSDLLEKEAERLSDPEEIEAIARERFNLVRPGEQAFAVIPTPAEPGDDAG